jgi:hypothetical protein
MKKIFLLVLLLFVQPIRCLLDLDTFFKCIIGMEIGATIILGVKIYQLIKDPTDQQISRIIKVWREQPRKRDHPLKTGCMTPNTSSNVDTLYTFFEPHDSLLLHAGKIEERIVTEKILIGSRKVHYAMGILL